MCVCANNISILHRGVGARQGSKGGVAPVAPVHTTAANEGGKLAGNFGGQTQGQQVLVQGLS